MNILEKFELSNQGRVLIDISQILQRIFIIHDAILTLTEQRFLSKATFGKLENVLYVARILETFITYFLRVQEKQKEMPSVTSIVPSFLKAHRQVIGWLKHVKDF